MILTAFPTMSKAQYKRDQIRGFPGLKQGAQARTDLDAGNVV
jgi:hypothetical protein